VDKNRLTLRGTQRLVNAHRNRIGPLQRHKLVCVTLSLRRKANPESTLWRFATPLKKKKYLSAAQAIQRFSHQSKDETAVRRFAREYDLECKDVQPGLIELCGTVANINRAFGIKLSLYAEEGSDTQYHGHEEEPTLPAYLKRAVTGVFGLDSHPAGRRPGITQKMIATAISPPPVTARTRRPKEFADLYNFPSAATGRGQSIGLLEFGGGFRAQSLKSYFASVATALPKIVVREIPPGANRPRGKKGTLNPDTEVYLDIEVAGSLARDADIVVYFGENTEQGWLHTLQAAILDERHDLSVISISWGQAEQNWSPSALKEIDRLFQLAAHRGITVCCSSGDNGVREAAGQSFSVVFPATSPHVLACGGTQLEVKRGGKRRETVWNQWRQYRLASGGGFSGVFSRPSYQENAKVLHNSNPHKGRGIPDVAANASSYTGYLIEADNTRMSMGGTSAVAPLWAALIARLNEVLGGKLGLLTPTVYEMAAEMRDSLCDIVEGFNGPTRNTGYQAKRGWDACTGLGSPHGEKMLEWLKLKRSKR